MQNHSKQNFPEENHILLVVDFFNLCIAQQDEYLDMQNCTQGILWGGINLKDHISMRQSSQLLRFLFSIASALLFVTLSLRAVSCAP